MAAIAALIAGGAISAFGSYEQGQAQKNAGQNAQNFAGGQYAQGQNNLGNLLYGNQLWNQMQPGQYGPPQQPQASQFMTKRSSASPDEQPTLDQQAYQAALQQYAQQKQQYDQTYGQSEQQRQASVSQGTGGSILQQYQDLIKRQGQGAAGIMGQYNAETGRLAQGDQAAQHQLSDYFAGQRQNLNGMAQQQQDTARQFGLGANRTIDAQSQVALQQANDSANAQLASRGFGNSTTLAGLNASNAASINRGAAAQKVGVQEQGSQMLQNAQQNQFGVNANLASQQGGLLGSFLQSQQANAYGRASGRTTQQYGNLSADLQMRQNIPNTLLSVQQGGVMNPWLNQNVSQYYPGVSGVGNAAVSGGNALAGFGGQMYGDQQSQNLLQMYLAGGRGQQAGSGTGGLGGRAAD